MSRSHGTDRRAPLPLGVSDGAKRPFRPLQERSFAGRWERYWFGDGSLVRLAVFRMILMAAAFWRPWRMMEDSSGASRLVAIRQRSAST